MNRAIIFDTFNQQWVCYLNPVETFIANNLSEVIPILKIVEQKTQQASNLHAVGFFSYESAEAFDENLPSKKTTNFPYAYFSLFNTSDRKIIEPQKICNSTAGLWQADITPKQYQQAIQKIKNYILSGDSYQVNYTYHLRCSFEADPLNYFFSLLGSQKTNYASFIDTQDFAVCSVSPELFFRLDQDKIISKPMKGTVKRGVNLEADNQQMAWLKTSEKNLAENTMIVDMIRNDLGRVCQQGTINVSQLHQIETYKTVLQMTSTVEGKTDQSLVDIFSALFPCSSIVGAPKKRTMEIINELEINPRKIYTGSIGYILPNRKCCFNVAIRTLLIDKQQKQAEYGVGGGIVWDSVTDNEYEESLTKAKVLEKGHPSIEILESILWQADTEYYLLELHMQRLKDSAKYLMIDYNEHEIHKMLDDYQINVLAKSPNDQHKVRLKLSEDGEIKIDSHIISTSEALSKPIISLAICNQSVNSQDWRLYHKIADRQVYSKPLASVKAEVKANMDDAILINEHDEVTEGTLFNIVVKKHNKLYTPPIECGLLPGVYRQFLLQKKELIEKKLSVKDLHEADELFVINSVRKWKKARLLQ